MDVYAWEFYIIWIFMDSVSYAYDGVFLLIGSNLIAYDLRFQLIFLLLEL